MFFRVNLTVAKTNNGPWIPPLRWNSLAFLGVPGDRAEVALFSTCLRYHPLRGEKAVKTNSWWGSLLSYQISV